MDSAHVGSLCMLGTERALGRQEVVLTLGMRESCPAAEVDEVTMRQVRARETLRSRLEETEPGRFVWRALEGALPGAPAPYRVRALDESTLEVRMDHALGNLRSLLFWFEDWLAIRAAGPESTVPPLRSPPVGRAPSAWRGARSALGFAADYHLRSGWRGAGPSLDVTRGRTPRPGDGACAMERTVFAPSEWRGVVERARAAGLSTTAFLVTEATRLLFEREPSAGRVLALVTADVGDRLSGYRRDRPGNPTAALLVRAVRARELTPQVARAFRRSRAGATLRILRTLDAPLRSEVRVVERARRTALRPLRERAPYEDFGFALASVRVDAVHARIRSACRWASARTSTQVPMFAFVTVEDATTLELNWPTSLVDEADVRSLADELARRLRPPQTRSR